MLPRLILIFVFLTLIVLAVKKGFSPTGEIIERVPGYPEPVALKKMEPVSEEEFLNNLPSASDYAFSMNPVEAPKEELKIKPIVRKNKLVKNKTAKRTVAAKLKIVKR
ncbi:MAG: hypothetical protein ACKN9V_04635 [Pseudomonadota bacterium]